MMLAFDELVTIGHVIKPQGRHGEMAVEIVSAAVSYRYRKDVATLSIGLLTAIVSGWTIVASLVFSLPTVQNLALASGLTLAGAGRPGS